MQDGTWLQAGQGWGEINDRLKTFPETLTRYEAERVDQFAKKGMGYPVKAQVRGTGGGGADVSQ